jgi:hypothetical protein
VADGTLKARASSSNPPKSEFISHQARGLFADPVQAALREDPSLARDIAVRMVEWHFPESIHSDVLSAVGLSFSTEILADKKRDPQFRQRILTAYESRCAVCGFDVRLGLVSIALDAAHIRWHLAGGPAREHNGLALCVLHHKTFDLGAFTLDPEGILLVSDQANGSTGFQEALMTHHGKPIRLPQRPNGSLKPNLWLGRAGKSSRVARGISSAPDRANLFSLSTCPGVRPRPPRSDNYAGVWNLVVNRCRAASVPMSIRTNSWSPTAGKT